MANEVITTFAGGQLDRAGHLRMQADWLQSRRQSAETRYLVMWQLRPLLALDGGLTIAWQPLPAVETFLRDGACEVFLGLQDGIAHFAVDVSAAGAERRDAPFQGPGLKYIDVRSAALQCDGPTAAILAQARSLIDWHARHGFCANCGQPTQPAADGYSRKCNAENCGSGHFPRTDPVTIMLVLDAEGDRCLLGRQPRFAPQSYSALAGFLEHGENIEESVRREVAEEVGIKINRVEYKFSQPWPFPSSLMIGCWGYAETFDIHLDPFELEDAKWFSRLQIASMVANWQDREQLRMPPPLSIAHQLARAWLAE